MSLKQSIRRALGAAGLEIYGARGGVYLCRSPHAGSAGPSLSLPQSCRTRLRREDGSAGGWVEVDGPKPQRVAVSSFVRLPMFPDGSVEEIVLVEVCEHLYRHDRRSAFREWRRILRPGGRLVIRGLPDFEAIAAAYVEAGAAGRRDSFGLDQVFRLTHGDPALANGPERMLKDAYTRESVTQELVAAGYEIVSAERVRREPEPAALRLDVEARRPG